MDTAIRITRSSPIRVLFGANFFLALHIFSAIFINSSFLAKFGNTSDVGFLYMLGAASAVGMLLIVPYLLRWFGAFALAIIFSSLEIYTVLAFGAATSLGGAGALFICYWSLTILLLYTMDIFIESTVEEERMTGAVRGATLTSANAALFFSPILGGLIIDSFGYFSAYAIAAACLIPFVLLISLRFRKFNDQEYPRPSISGAFRELSKTPGARTVFVLHTLLRIFFSVTVIYLPLYLLQIGFEWPEIGTIFSIMLVPLVLFELPIGRVINHFGERRLFAFGFLLLAGGACALAFLGHANIALWGIVLLAAHTGASIVEVVSESAFFRRVGGKDAEQISLFRMLRPGGYVLTPIVAAFVLPLFGFSGMFILTALLMTAGVAIAVHLPRD